MTTLIDNKYGISQLHYTAMLLIWTKQSEHGLAVSQLLWHLGRNGYHPDQRQSHELLSLLHRGGLIVAVPDPKDYKCLAGYSLSNKGLRKVKQIQSNGGDVRY